MPSTKKRVAIVGAGPGGLVAAHKLLQTGLSVTVYEKGTKVGGLWSTKINPEMRTNSSMFTAAFSDLSWESVDLDGQPAPIAPKAWMLERYLQEYTRRYVLAGQEEGEQRLRFQTCVNSATRVMGKWRVVSFTNGTNGQTEHTEYFDYLVLATGYLSDPRPLDCDIGGNVSASIPILHSTEYRHFHQLELKALQQGSQPRRVLVVGGSHSGSDMASLIGWQASNECWAPRKSGNTPPPVEIIHVTPHQVFAVPQLSRDYDNPCAFQPYEYKVFERVLRGTEPIQHTFGLATREDSKNKRMMAKVFLSGDDWVDDEDNDLPPYYVISETYNHLVRNGIVKPVIGRLKSLQKGDADEEHIVTAKVRLLNGQGIHLDNISAVINATGFNSRGSLSFLAEDVQNDLGFMPLNQRVPLMLNSTYLCQNSNVPDVALLGFNGNISWGIVEMQSRAVAAKWATDEVASVPSPAVLETRQNVTNYIRAVRESMKHSRRHEVPQVAFDDFVGMMEQCGRELDLERVDLEFGETEGFICAARYVDSPMGSIEATKTIARLQDIQRRARDAKMFLARSVFHGLAGKWVSEVIHKGGASHTREVEMFPRFPTDPTYHFEYVAIERFKTVTAESEQSDENRTILRYTEHSDEVSAWEVDPRDQLKAKDEPIYKLKFYRSGLDDHDSCSATVSGSSDNDVPLHYRFLFKGVMLNNIHIQNNGETFSLSKPAAVPIVGDTKTESMQIFRPQPVRMDSYPAKITAGTGTYTPPTSRPGMPHSCYNEPIFHTGTPLRNALSS